MNIFVLHFNPYICATYHCDIHVIKMILEYAQILSTTHRLLDAEVSDAFYKATHKHHPCVKWAMTSKANYEWLYKLFCALCDKYTLQRGKVHLSDKKLRKLLANYPKNIPQIENLTPFPLAMPDDCKMNNVIESYRLYYIMHKSYFAKWEYNQPHGIPWWFH